MPNTMKQCPSCPRQCWARSKHCIYCETSARKGFPAPVPTVPAAPPEPAVVLAADRTVARQKVKLANLRSAYNESLKTIERLESEQGITASLRHTDPFIIEPHHGSGTSEATVVAVASDWHLEESVGPEVGGLNVFNLEIAHQRVTKFFQSIARLTRLLQQDVAIPTMVLALLGDFISNNIHEEIAELAEVAPTHALMIAQNAIISGIKFLLKQTTCNFVIPCHSGNHARTTKTTRFSAENGHSLEYLMYLNLQMEFRNEPRVTFIVPASYHSYMNIYGTTVRFHHGHAVKYNGGVGGLTIPINKSISQWNKARHADLDVMGHFHQRFDGGNFIANGSLIGYNGFAVAIKASYEEPAQQLFLIDKKRGKTCVWPVLVK